MRSSEAQLITLLAGLGRIIVQTDSIRVYRVERGTLDRVIEIGSQAAPHTKGALIL